MTSKKNIYIKLSALLIITGACFSCAKIKTPKAIEERENWYASFSDSIKYYEDEKANIHAELEALNTSMSEQMQSFEKVKKPREVCGYYIVKGWSGKTPLKSTGIYARIDENEKLELIATLSGSTFNRIGAGGNYSETVRHDQALNYRHDTYNTVYFTGGKADTIAQYIADHRNGDVKLEFMEGGSTKSRFTLPADEKDMISRTWTLYSSQLEIQRLQKELALCSRKIDTFVRLKDSHDQTKETDTTTNKSN